MRSTVLELQYLLQLMELLHFGECHEPFKSLMVMTNILTSRHKHKTSYASFSISVPSRLLQTYQHGTATLLVYFIILNSNLTKWQQLEVFRRTKPIVWPSPTVRHMATNAISSLNQTTPDPYVLIISTLLSDCFQIPWIFTEVVNNGVTMNKTLKCCDYRTWLAPRQNPNRISVSISPTSRSSWFNNLYPLNKYSWTIKHAILLGSLTIVSP